MPTKSKPERSTEVPEKANTFNPDQIKEMITRAVEEIGQTILREHPEIKIRNKKNE